MSNARLPNPIRPLMREQSDEAQLQRMWRKIEAGESRRPRLWPAAGIAIGATVLAALAFLLLTGGSDNPGPLRLANGQALANSSDGVTKLSDGVTKLSDGSQLTVQEHSLVEVLDNSDSSFTAALRHGRVFFSVKPGGPRTWRVECGSITVEVVGTVFSVERAGTSVTVMVERGAVLVRGEDVPHAARRLIAGQRIVVEIPGHTANQHPLPVEPTVADLPVVAPPGGEAGVIDPTAVEPSAVAREAGPPESPRSRPTANFSDDSVEEVLRKADLARQSGDVQTAVKLLSRVVRKHPRAKRSALAAVTLGRLYLDSLGDAEKAIWALDRALAIGGLPDALEEQTYQRLVSALNEAGRTARAARIEAKMRKRFPNTNPNKEQATKP